MEKAITLRERFFAMLLHAIFSFALLSFALYLIFHIWYPAPLDYAAGVTSLSWMLLGIDLILGPLLTFIVFKRDKLKLFFDLVIIILIQISAYGYGLYTLYQGRPAWLVFVIDDFELIRPVDIAEKDWSTVPEKFSLSIFKGPQWIGASYSKIPDIMKRQKEAEMFDGISLAQKPEAYVPLNEKKDRLKQAALPLSDLFKYNSADRAGYFTAAYPLSMRYVPIKGINADISALIDKDLHFAGAVPLSPWKD